MVWEYPTNYSNGTSVDGSPGRFFLDYPMAIIANYANGFLFLIWIVLFAALFTFGVGEAIVAASFASAVLGVYFAAQGLVSTLIPISLFIIAIVATLALLFGRR